MSWKQFGGIHNMDKMSTISVTTIVADNMTLRSSYLGTLDICGNVVIKNNLIVEGNIDFNSRLYVQNDLIVDGNYYLLGNTIAEANVEMHSNVLIYENLYLGSGATTYFYGDSTGIGVNKTDPETTFDIYGTSVETLNVYSTQTTNRNILARNANNQGIQLTTNSSTSSIGFFNDQTISSSSYDGQIQYQTGGVMVIDVSENTQILSKVSISNRNSVEHILNENTVIYDICGSVFLYDVYNNSEYYSGNALSLVASDNSYNTFLNIITPNHTGLSIGGGSYANDSNRAMGTIGCIDKSGNYVPTQNIVRGNSLVHNKTTLGINTHAPRTENYTLDVNGPLHLTNGELTNVNSSTFEAKHIHFSEKYPNYGLTVGTPYDISRYTDADGVTSTTFYQKVLSTSNGGKSWKSSRIVDSSYLSTDLENQNNILYSAYVYDQSYSFIGGETDYLFYSNDGGSNWQGILIESGESSTIYSIHVADITNSNYKRLVLTYDALFLYFDVSFTVLDSYMNTTDNYIIDTSEQNYVTPSPIIDLNTSSGYENYIYVAGGGIQKYDLSNHVFIDTRSHSIPSESNTYNSIHAYDSSYVIAVGNYIISYSKNGGKTWTDITTDSVLQSVNMYDASNAIAVGNSGKIMYTKTSGDIWFTASRDILNSSGNEKRLADSSYQLTGVSIYDANSFVVTTLTTEFDYNSSTNYTLGETDVIYCYLPNVLNRENHYVLDVCGNMRLWGDMWIGDDSSYGIIQSTNPVFKLLNDSVDEIYLGSDATMIMMGKDGDGSTFIQHSLDISQNLTVHGYLHVFSYQIIEGITTYKSNLTVDGIGYFGNTTTSSNTTTGSVIVSGGVGIAKDVYIGGNTNIGGNVYLGTIYGATYIGNTDEDATTIHSTSISTGALVVYGGAGISGNVRIGGSIGGNTGGNTYILANSTASTNTTSGTLVVTGGAGISGNVHIGGNTASTNTTSGTLVVTGGAGISGNTYVGGNVYLGNVLGNTYIGNSSVNAAATSKSTGALVVYGGAGVSGNVHIGGNTVSANSTSGTLVVTGGAGISGNVYIGGNTYILANSTAAGNSTSGTLVVTGGVGISGNTHIDGNAYIGGNAATTTYITATTDINGTNTSTGALVVTGGVAMQGNVNIENIVILNSTQDATKSTTSYSGALQIRNGGAYIAGNIVANKNVYIGGNVTTVSSSTTSGSLVVTGGVGISGNVYIGGNGASSGNTTGGLVVTGGAYIGGNSYLAGVITMANSTASTSSTTGALKITGGAYIGGASYLDGVITMANTTASTGSTTGALKITGGAYIGDASYLDGVITMANATAGSNGAGALKISGGAYIGGASYLAGVITMASGTGSSSTTSGSLVVTGGVGISGNVYIGGSGASTGSSSGGLVVTGGAYIGGNSYLAGNIKIAGGTTSTSYTDGALVVTGSAGFSANIYCNNYTNSVYFNATSDYRIKTNVTQLDSSYNVDSLKPIHYINTRGNKEDIGFLAHEVQEIYPFLVSGEKDGTDYQSINYNGFIGILVKEIQDLKKTVAELQNKVSEIQDSRV